MTTKKFHHPSSVSSGIRATWVGVVVNLALVILKLWAGFLSRSQALIADGVHSVSDLFGDFVVILGLKLGRKREDEDHLYGHARIETISGMVVGLLLLLVGLGIGYNAVHSIYHHESSIPSLLAIYAAAISILLKEIMFWYTLVVGRRLRSVAMIGNAWHHRSDALSSVAVLLGVGATYVNPNWHLADSYAALLVTFFVIKIGVSLTWSAFKELADTAPDKELLAGYAETVERIGGVLQVHDMAARYSGAQIFVELHVVVDPELTVREGHNIASEAKRRLLDDFPDVTRVIVHVDPEPKEQG